jgi:HAD superfamily hydrolase (TIGR01459 family)
MRAMHHIPQHSGLAPLAENYDGFILDLWGVLHDGVVAFPEAIACMEELQARNKRVAVLSNAPRRAVEVEQRMNELGIRKGLYDSVLSSGEVAWRHLHDRYDHWHRALGRRCFHLGPDRDKGMRDDLDLDFVEVLEEAEFVLNTGAHMSEDTVETYGAELRAAAEAGLPMVCANPDLEVIRGGKREICAGMLAKRYEELGGTVRYHGKPHADVYDACLASLAIGDKGRVLGVGDSLRTDIAGASAAGIDGRLVLGGIHADALGLTPGEAVSPDRLAAFCQDLGERPKAAIPVFRW